VSYIHDKRERLRYIAKELAVSAMLAAIVCVFLVLVKMPMAVVVTIAYSCTFLVLSSLSLYLYDYLKYEKSPNASVRTYTRTRANRIITLEDLTSRNACSEQVEKFKVAYPNGFEVTAENLLEAHGYGFEVLWTRCLLSRSAVQVYEAATASALETYRAVRGSTQEVLDAATAPAWEVYDAAIASAREDFDAARIKALADVLNGEQA
jgi:hypothetical protein